MFTGKNIGSACLMLVGFDIRERVKNIQRGGGPHFLGGVHTIFILFRGGTDQFQHF